MAGESRPVGLRMLNELLVLGSGERSAAGSFSLRRTEDLPEALLTAANKGAPHCVSGERPRVGLGDADGDTTHRRLHGRPVEMAEDGRAYQLLAGREHPTRDPRVAGKDDQGWTWLANRARGDVAGKATEERHQPSRRDAFDPGDDEGPRGVTATPERDSQLRLGRQPAEGSRTGVVVFDSGAKPSPAVQVHPACCTLLLDRQPQLGEKRRCPHAARIVAPGVWLLGAGGSRTGGGEPVVIRARPDRSLGPEPVDEAASVQAAEAVLHGALSNARRLTTWVVVSTSCSAKSARMSPSVKLDRLGGSSSGDGARSVPETYLGIAILPVTWGVVT